MSRCKDCDAIFKNSARIKTHEVFYSFKDGTVILIACKKHIKKVTDMFKQHEKQNRN